MNRAELFGLIANGEDSTVLAHNGTEPVLIAEEHRFTAHLWKQPKQANA